MNTFLIAIGLLALATAASADEIAIHEWGTFTSLQDEQGRTLAGINTDDEPAPAFVHNRNSMLLLEPDQAPTVLFQGAPRCHPDVTMRLETPVIYFHLPAQTTAPLTATLMVQWHGGWLTQYYPDAQTDSAPAFGPLSETTTGRLTWYQLKIGGHSLGPSTTEHVWTSPRAVQAESVTTTAGETERFLFYRGVGHVPAPIRVVRHKSQFHCFSQLSAAEDSPLSIGKLWLAEFRPNSKCAFRELPPAQLGSDTNQVLISTAASFPEQSFSTDNIPKLQSRMQEALIQDGLFQDEAQALLRTWELSYFKSSGLRLFFLVPRAWTDKHLPLTFSAPAKITRVMVGRLELVTPEQRRLLRKIADGPVLSKPWAHFSVEAGKSAIVGSMPQAYRDLGRFRNALVLEEEKQRPTRALREFIRINGLEATGR